MGRRGWSVVAGALVVFLLSIGIARMPVPYVALMPGRTVDTLGTIDGKDVIELSGTSSTPSEGELSLTTVSVFDGLDLLSALRYWWDDSVAVVPREAFYPPGVDPEEVNKESEAAWVASQEAAQVAALGELGHPVYARVTGFADNSPSKGALRKGDVLISVNGEPIEAPSDLVREVRSVTPGDSVVIGYIRDDVPGEASVTASQARDEDAKGSIGVTFKPELPSDPTITFAVDGIGGPSAGLMFALGIIDKIDPTDLTGGLDIAGTGTITMSGEVGPIGGVTQKMLGARAEGAEIFLTPVENCDVAKRSAPDGLRLIKVETLDDALDALASVRNQSGEPPTC